MIGELNKKKFTVSTNVRRYVENSISIEVETLYRD